MPRLNELNQALITVIVDYTAVSSPSTVEDLFDKPVAEIYAHLDNLIDLSTQAGSTQSLLLHALLDNIITLTVFLRPVKRHAVAATGEPPRPLHEQLIKGQKIPTKEELLQQLSDLAIKTQALVAKPPQESTDVSSEFVMVQHDPETPEEPHLSLEMLLQEKLFLTLGLRPKDSPDKIHKQITKMVEEHLEVTRLVAENRRQSEEIWHLSSEIRRLNASQRQPSGLTSCGFKFATQLVRKVSGLTGGILPILPIFDSADEVTEEQPTNTGISACNRSRF